MWTGRNLGQCVQCLEKAEQNTTSVMTNQSRDLVRELLMRNGVDQVTAKYAAINELAGWNLEFLIDFWKQVKRPGPDFCPCRDVLHQPRKTRLRDWIEDLEGSKEEVGAFDFGEWLNTVFAENPRWIKGPRKLMELAVKEDKALCVNKSGDWSLRANGYMAISHVWAEGIQSDPEGRGFKQQQLSHIFNIIRNTGAEWIWIDVLAIPGGGGLTATIEDDLLKIEIINTMGTVYSKADAVIILDALALQLHPRSGIDIAVALRCGRWATRLWTYQEMKLANRALIVTGQGTYDYKDLMEVLKEFAKLPLFKSMYHSLVVLQRNDELGVSLSDIVFACQTRKAGLDLDYARALFPVLGLKWEEGMTREEGMRMIYCSPNQRCHASRIVSFYGCPRLSIRPSWAPAYLTGLEGAVGAGMDWERRGLRGEWRILKVNKTFHTFTQFKKRIFNLQAAESEGRPIQCVLAESEAAAAILGLEDAIKNGTVYILSEQAVEEILESGLAPKILLVEQASTPGDSFEAYVHCSAVVTSAEVYPAEVLSVLLRHEKPVTDQSLSDELDKGGKLSSQLLLEILRYETESPLHVAV